MTSTVEPAYDEGTTEQRDTMRQEPERKPEPHPTRGETATPPALNITEKQQTYGSGQRKEQKTRTPPSRTKGNIMKNNTFNQIINANLASVDPASASSHSPRPAPICSRRSSTSDPRPAQAGVTLTRPKGLRSMWSASPFSCSDQALPRIQPPQQLHTQHRTQPYTTACVSRETL